MDIVVTFFLVIFALAALLIIGLVLLQDEQGEGFGGLFGGGGASSAFGVSGASILSKITTFLAAVFMLSSLAVALSLQSGEKDNVIGESRQASGTGRDWFVTEEPSLEESDPSLEVEVDQPTP